MTRTFLRMVSLIVPSRQRERFLREWHGELENEQAIHGRGAGLLAVLGALPDAVAIRRLTPRNSGSDRVNKWLSEIRTSARALRKSPMFSVVTVLTLAIGMGGAASIYTLLDRVVLDPLPYPQPDRLVALDNRVPGVGANTVWGMSTAQQQFIRENDTPLESFGIYRGLGANLQTPDGPIRARGWWVTSEVMDILGARPLLGRIIDRTDDGPGSERVVVLSRGFWERQFAADREIIGTSLTMSGEPFEIIGVLDRDITAPNSPPGLVTDLWVPLRIDPDARFYNNHTYSSVGRMAEGVAPDVLEAELARLQPGLLDRFPQAYTQGFFDGSGFATRVRPLIEAEVGDMGDNLWILFGSVTLVFLIAVANVTNLFLVRIESRTRELAVRQAVGASRADLARYVFSESMLVAGLGAIAAILVTWVGGPWLLRLAPETLPRIENVGVGWETILFTAGSALFVGLALGGYSLVKATGVSTLTVMGSGGRTTSDGREKLRFRSVLVTTQVALALTLVVGAGLLLQSINKLAQIDPGIEPEGVVTFDLYLDPSGYEDDIQVWGTYSRILEQVRAIPGVTHAGMSTELPVEGGYGCTVQGFEDQNVYEHLRQISQGTCAGQEITSPGFFEALDIPVLRGRAFTYEDMLDPTRGPVVISNEFANRFFPDQDPIGQGIGPNGRNEPPYYRVVGVVGDVPAGGLDGETANAIYYPIVHIRPLEGNWGRWKPTALTMVVKANVADPMDIAPAVTAAVREADPGAPIARVITMEEIIDRSMARFSFTSTLLAIAAGVALALASIGLYGVVSYVVSRSSREIGMRIAIGASPGRVQRTFVRKSLSMVVAGVALGLLAAAGTSRLLQGLLYDVDPMNPVTFVGASLLLMVASFVASWIPARRASHVDPIEVLRAE